MRPRFLALLAGLVLVAAGRGQEKNAKPGPKGDGNAIEVRFADDSTVKMVLLHGSIDVTTRYGKLTVPGEEIRRIEFGRRVTEETAKKIDAAVARLGSA